MASLFDLNSALSLYSIPLVWLTAFFPVVLRTRAIKGAVGFNNLQPRQNVDRVKSASELDKEIVNRIARFEGAHQNGMENLPIWFAAVILGNYAALPNRTLNLFSAAYIAIRLFYNNVYINQRTQAQGVLRTLLYFVGLSLPLTLLFKAASKVHNASV